MRSNVFLANKKVDSIRQRRTLVAMLTVAETPVFVHLVDDYWDESERMDFISFIANNPEAGPIIAGSGGLRKVRWQGNGKGKRGGVRIIYYVAGSTGTIWLLTIYGKNVKDTIPAHILRLLKKELDI